MSKITQEQPANAIPGIIGQFPRAPRKDVSSEMSRNKRQLPCENLGFVCVAGHNMSGVVFESVEYRLVDIELIVFVNITKISYVNVHSTWARVMRLS